MLDSGAYSVWSKGKSIDLDKYVTFCQQHPEIDYYVNLDVIPGTLKKTSLRMLGGTERDVACEQGWQNYQNMIQELPASKVLPVFHMGDSIKWLTKYLEAGVDYVGLGGAVGKPAAACCRWLRSLSTYLFDNNRPLVKTHGFGITDWQLMSVWQWHSVDSTSWRLSAAWGGVFLPRKRKGCFDYSQAPFVVPVSDQSPHVNKFRRHGLTLTPTVKTQLDEWLEICGVSFEEVHTTFFGRLKVNAEFFNRVQGKLSVDYIYLAGPPQLYPMEFSIPYRLLSYAQPTLIDDYLGKIEAHERQPRRPAQKRHLDTTRHSH